MFDIEPALDHLEKSGIDPKYKAIMAQFFKQYAKAISSQSAAPSLTTLQAFVDGVEAQCKEPYPFELFHKQIDQNYQMGCELFEPLIDMERSSVMGESSLEEIEALLAKGENVVLLSNHQIEADPHVLFTLLKNRSFAKQIIFVAGERVILDPLAAPMSLGCNLLCIYSKKYIDHPPEKRADKGEHNTKTMHVMREILGRGGACIWVAPSGGRDRRGPDGSLAPAPFDAQSVEMFHLIGKKCGAPTHFFPLSIDAYDLLPPPDGIQVDLGEARATERAPAGLYFGKRLDLDNLADKQLPKPEYRAAKARAIYEIVKKNYDELCDSY